MTTNYFIKKTGHTKYIGMTCDKYGILLGGSL